MKSSLLLTLVCIAFADQKPINLKQRYLEMHDIKLWENKLVEEMDGATYDKTVADPWFGPHPFLTNHEKPLVLAFMKQPIYSFHDVGTVKDSFVMKTLYLLAQDFGHNFRF